MKAYSILLWLILFNAVLGMLGTFIPPAVDSDGNPVDPDNSSNVGGRDIFGIGSIPGAVMLPMDNVNLTNDLYDQFESFKTSWSTGNIGSLLAEILIMTSIFFQLLFGIITYLPSLLVLFGVPQAVVDVINIGVFIVTFVAAIQIITNKWLTIGE